MIVELGERLDIFAVESQRTDDLLFSIFVGYVFCDASKEALATVKQATKKTFVNTVMSSTSFVLSFPSRTELDHVLMMGDDNIQDSRGTTVTDHPSSASGQLCVLGESCARGGVRIQLGCGECVTVGIQCRIWALVTTPDDRNGESESEHRNLACLSIKLYLFSILGTPGGKTYDSRV